MSMNCEVILRWDATPGQLRAVGAALWGWCNRAAGDQEAFQYLNNQGLADLIAGELPRANWTLRQAERRGVHFRVGGEARLDRQATIDSLRREIPLEGVADVVIDGTGWNPVVRESPLCATLQGQP
jgi:hypothetical protein